MLHVSFRQVIELLGKNTTYAMAYAVNNHSPEDDLHRLLLQDESSEDPEAIEVTTLLIFQYIFICILCSNILQTIHHINNNHDKLKNGSFFLNIIWKYKVK